MPSPNLVLLYVEDSTKSAAFYRELLGRDPVFSAPTYTGFALEGGLMLGLWARRSVQPAPSDAGNRTELAFMVGDAAEVESTYADWRARGVSFAQELTQMVFGPTFVALDPDGHRLRVCLRD